MKSPDSDGFIADFYQIVKKDIIPIPNNFSQMIESHSMRPALP